MKNELSSNWFYCCAVITDYNLLLTRIKSNIFNQLSYIINISASISYNIIVTSKHFYYNISLHEVF